MKSPLTGASQHVAFWECRDLSGASGRWAFSSEGCIPIVLRFELYSRSGAINPTIQLIILSHNGEICHECYCFVFTLFFGNIMVFRSPQELWYTGASASLSALYPAAPCARTGFLHMGWRDSWQLADRVELGTFAYNTGNYR